MARGQEEAADFVSRSACRVPPDRCAVYRRLPVIGRSEGKRNSLPVEVAASYAAGPWATTAGPCFGRAAITCEPGSRDFRRLSSEAIAPPQRGGGRGGPGPRRWPTRGGPGLSRGTDCATNW